jgi:hypothetical protein
MPITENSLENWQPNLMPLGVLYVSPEVFLVERRLTNSFNGCVSKSSRALVILLFIVWRLISGRCRVDHSDSLIGDIYSCITRKATIKAVGD